MDPMIGFCAGFFLRYGKLDLITQTSDDQNVTHIFTHRFLKLIKALYHAHCISFLFI
jgi:hypothetical protein